MNGYLKKAAALDTRLPVLYNDLELGKQSRLFIPSKKPLSSCELPRGVFHLRAPKVLQFKNQLREWRPKVQGASAEAKSL
jgi:hypothetical protein